MVGLFFRDAKLLAAVTKTRGNFHELCISNLWLASFCLSRHWGRTFRVLQRQHTARIQFDSPNKTVAMIQWPAYDLFLTHNEANLKMPPSIEWFSDDFTDEFMRIEIFRMTFALDKIHQIIRAFSKWFQWWKCSWFSIVLPLYQRLLFLGWNRQLVLSDTSKQM